MRVNITSSLSLKYDFWVLFTNTVWETTVRLSKQWRPLVVEYTITVHVNTELPVHSGCFLQCPTFIPWCSSLITLESCSCDFAPHVSSLTLSNSCISCVSRRHEKMSWKQKSILSVAHTASGRIGGNNNNNIFTSNVVTASFPLSVSLPACTSSFTSFTFALVSIRSEKNCVQKTTQ